LNKETRHGNAENPVWAERNPQLLQCVPHRAVLVRLPVPAVVNAAAAVLGLLLSVSALKCISYAVDRSKIAYVGLGLLLQAAGLAALMYAAGVFAPFPR